MTSAASTDRPGPVLDLDRARHFHLRFGFSATREELERTIGRRAGEVFDDWVDGRAPYEPRDYRLIRWEQYGCDQDGNEIDAPELEGLTPKEIGARRQEYRKFDKQQFRTYLETWLAQAQEHPRPLRDRMVLFWLGYFPANVAVTLRRYELLMQHQLFRRLALAPFGQLLDEVVHDAAMLGYFDNDTNSKEHPNENFARELLELYSLGEGNYTEVDVREAARALTGHQGESGVFHFDEALHDFGEKTLLGETAPFDGRSLVALLLRQEACARHLSRRLLTHFEGSEPEEERLEEYARELRASGYDVRALLRRLATDEAFYAPDVVARRVIPPVEWVLGIAHRLESPPCGEFLLRSPGLLGQMLYSPPSVKGWDEGEAWLTHSTLLARELVAGMELGLVGRPRKEWQNRSELDATQRHRAYFWAAARPDLVVVPELAPQLERDVERTADDEALILAALDRWLPREATPELLEEARRLMAEARSSGELTGPLLEHAEAEHHIRHLALLILSSPEAQLG